MHINWTFFWTISNWSFTIDFLQIVPFAANKDTEELRLTKI